MGDTSTLPLVRNLQAQVQAARFAYLQKVANEKLAKRAIEKS